MGNDLRLEGVPIAGDIAENAQAFFLSRFAQCRP